MPGPPCRARSGMPPDPTVRYQTLSPGTRMVPSRLTGGMVLVADWRGVIASPTVVTPQEEACEEGQDCRSECTRGDFGDVPGGIQLDEIDGRHAWILPEDEERLEEIRGREPIGRCGGGPGRIAYLQYVDVDRHVDRIRVLAGNFQSGGDRRLDPEAADGARGED